MTKQKIELAVKKRDAHPQTRRMRRLLTRILWHLMLSCGIVLMLLLAMFLLAKGPAYIFFEEDRVTGSLSALYSQAIHLNAESMTADITESTGLSTRICGKTIVLSSAALSAWAENLMEITDIRDTHLVLEGTSPWTTEISCDNTGGTTRYMIQHGQSASIDPSQSAAVSASFAQLLIYPQVNNGEAYESFVTTDRDITVNVPHGADIRLYITYTDSTQKMHRIPITQTLLPVYNTQDSETWSFTLCDMSLQIQAVDKDPLQLNILGRYMLNLSCVGVAQIRGYLSGNLLFQNTNTPKSYGLAGQLVDIRSRNNALGAVICKDLRQNPQAEEKLLINGEATGMDISGVDPFPDLRMWFRENIYMAPVSLLSVMISMYGLSSRAGSRKVKPKRIS